MCSENHKRVNIILCTWQGEKFLGECLDSIANQTYSNWKLYIADDGSRDATLHQIRRYEKKYPDRVYFLGQNIEQMGPCRNFLAALANPAVSDADYFMFADQDDVWFRDKIEKSVRKMEEMEAQYGAGQPLLAHCDSRVVDENLREISPSYTAYLQMDQNNDRFSHLLLQNIVTGGGTILNQSLRTMMGEIPDFAVMHDHWAALIASAFGHICYIDAPLYAYRQHVDNEIGARNGSMLHEVAARLGLGSKNSRQQADSASKALYTKLFRQAASFRTVFAGELDQDQKELLDAFIDIPNQNRFGKIKTVLKYGFTYDKVYRTIGELFFI